MPPPNEGTLLGDLAATDMGPLVADLLDPESCRDLALSGVQGRALARRRSVVTVGIVEGSVIDLAAEARVDSEGTRRARDCYTLHVWLASECMRIEGFPQPYVCQPDPEPWFWSLRVPDSVLKCVASTTLLDHGHLARLRDALPPRASLDVSCSIIRAPRDSLFQPVRVNGLKVDWLDLPRRIPEIVAADHLVLLDIGIGVRWTDPDPAAMPSLPNLRVFSLTSVHGNKISAPDWLVWCCALPRLKHVTLANVQQGRLPDLPTNDSIVSMALRARDEREGETTNLRGCLSAFAALENLSLARIPVRDVFRELHGLRVARLCLEFVPRKPHLKSCSLPCLRALMLTDRRVSDFDLPSAPVLELLDVWFMTPGPLEACDRLADASTSLPLLSTVVLNQGFPTRTVPSQRWIELEWTVEPVEVPFRGHRLTRPRRRAA